MEKIVEKIVIILAAGSSTRLQGDMPKQFRCLADYPLLMHTIEAFYRFDPKLRFIVVLQEEMIPLWFELIKNHEFKISCELVPGGTERFFSVRNALQTIKTDSMIAVHDAVRPFVSQETIDNCFRMAKTYGNAVPVVEMTDSVRQLVGNRSQSVPRSNYFMVHTPQVFRAELLHRAYSLVFKPDFTDDASMVESLGYPIQLCAGNAENRKITTESDWEWAEYFISKWKEKNK